MMTRMPDHLHIAALVCCIQVVQGLYLTLVFPEMLKGVVSYNLVLCSYKVAGLVRIRSKTAIKINTAYPNL